MKRLVFAIMLVSFAVTGGQVLGAITFGPDGGASLQGVLDFMTVPNPGISSVDVTTDSLPDSVDSLWRTTASGTAVSTVIVELAAFADSNVFGIYDSADPNTRLQLFGGGDGFGDAKAVSILSDGRVFVNFGATDYKFEGDCFGFYLDSSARDGGGLFFSDTALNADATDHMAAYQGEGDLVRIPLLGGFTDPATWTENEYVLAWEDLVGGGDKDYEDFVVMVESIESCNPVPEPVSIAIWSLIGLFGLTFGWWRRRGNRASLSSTARWPDKNRKAILDIVRGGQPHD